MGFVKQIINEAVGVGVATVQENVWRDKWQVESFGDTPVGYSDRGTPVFDSLVFDGISLGFGANLVVFAYGLELSQSKTIVETPLVGRDGTVKEYISNGDYQIKIDVTFFSNQIDTYPEESVRLLKRILDYNGNITIYNKFMDRLGITEVVIKDHSLTSETYTQQGVTINAIQDRSFEVEFLNLNR